MALLVQFGGPSTWIGDGTLAGTVLALHSNQPRRLGNANYDGDGPRLSYVILGVSISVLER